MNAKPMIFAGLAITALCLVTLPKLRANDATNQSVPDRQQQYTYPVVVNNGAASQSSGSPNQHQDIGKAVISEPPGQSGGNGGEFTPNQNQYPAPINKAGSLIGMKVKNENNETLGKNQGYRDRPAIWPRCLRGIGKGGENSWHRFEHLCSFERLHAFI